MPPVQGLDYDKHILVKRKSQYQTQCFCIQMSLWNVPKTFILCVTCAVLTTPVFLKDLLKDVLNR